MVRLDECLDLMKRIGIKFDKNNKDRYVYENAFDNSLMNACLLEEKEDNDESREVRQMIESNKFWIRNDYEGFINSLMKSTRTPFLSKYTPKQLADMGVQTYQLKGYNIGYALKPDPSDGLVDIISLHNNEPNIAHIGDALIESAKANGGNKLDHYDGFLSNLYDKHGFKETERFKWNDDYADPNWDYEKYGRPDVICRQLK